MSVAARSIGIDLFWIPLGAGGNFVPLNGRVYEAIEAALQRRPRYDLYHSGLVVVVPDGRYTIEQTPARPHGEKRGVVGIGPIGGHWIAHWHLFRYELRRWRDGVIPDIGEAVDSPQRLSSDPAVAKRLLDLLPEVPFLCGAATSSAAVTCGTRTRKLPGCLPARALMSIPSSRPPGGRAPGWHAGLVAAARHLTWRPESSTAIAAESITTQ